MTDNEQRGPGRPTTYASRMQRVQVLITEEQRDDAERQAKVRGVSVSQVLRDWIESGRAHEAKLAARRNDRR